MKTKFVTLLASALLMAGSVYVQAQPKTNEKTSDKPRLTEEELMQRRAKYMASTLMLDDKTEADFIKSYSQYLKELKDCRSQYKDKAPEPRKEKAQESRKPLTDAEIEKQIEKRFEQQRQILDIHEKYYKEFKKILTPKQLMKVFSGKRQATRRQPVPGYKKEIRRNRPDCNGHRYHHQTECCPC